ncbi:MAG: two-component sensor histidine kinase [Bacteroidales bacterium]|nr:two-component sensor histidine kinase [Bacteroidales bacterium]
MPFHRSYKIRLFFNILSVFIVAIVVITFFQYHREKEYRRSLVESTLRTVGDITERYIRVKHIRENGRYRLLDSLSILLPQKNIRITVIARDGLVLYDNFVKDYEKMENHLQRPEVQVAMREREGSDIRRSATTGQEFFYFVKDYGDYFIRTAELYDVTLVRFLRTDHLFIYFTLMMFLATVGVLIYMTGRLGTTISRLKDFAVRAGNDQPIDTAVTFPRNEFGIISRQIIQMYENLRSTRDELYAEREKLYRHLQVIDEGVALFSAEKKTILSNSRFMQYVNLIAEKTVVAPETFLELKEAEKLTGMVEEHLKNPHRREKQLTLQASGRFFAVQCIFFPDGSFEVLINDITRQEKNRLIKQQMISNLAHELKTPVTSVMGYLETLIGSGEIDENTRRHFIQRAYKQTRRLTALINDISVLNRIGEAEAFFRIKSVKVRKVIREVTENLQVRLDEKQIRVKIHVGKDTVITGSRELVYSIFQNLMENTILYGGERVEVDISRYLEDENFYYFSYSDTGPGIPAEYHARIFERFYRVDKGRSRKEGGTGLGLSIVKNAVFFHQGEITVRNRPGGGVEFLFTLAKKRPAK